MKGFHPGPIVWVSHLGLWVVDPMIFYFLSVGSHYLSNRHRVPHFLPSLSHFSRFTPIITRILPVLVLCTPVFSIFMIRATSLTPSLCSFYLSGYL